MGSFGMAVQKYGEEIGLKIGQQIGLAKAVTSIMKNNFNRQVRNNAAKFEGDDFMFRLTRDELKELSRCKNFTTIQTKGVKSGSPYLPYAFTEQGVYMLMTVLRGDLAI